MWNRVGNNAWQTCCLTFLLFIPIYFYKAKLSILWLVSNLAPNHINIGPCSQFAKTHFPHVESNYLHRSFFFFFFFLYKNQGYNSEKTVVGKSINQKQLHQLCLLLCITQCQGHVIFGVYVVPPGEESPTFLYQTIMWMWHAEHVNRQHVSLISRIFVKADWRLSDFVCACLWPFSVTWKIIL